MRALGAALALYALRNGATYLLDGRSGRLPRPEGTLDRVVSALVANVPIGTVGTLRRLAIAAVGTLVAADGRRLRRGRRGSGRESP